MFSPVRRPAVADFQQPQVSRTSDEFTNVQYRLSSGLRSFTASINKVFNVTNPQLTSRFEKFSEGKLVLDTWVDTSLLEGENSINDILHQGFSLPQPGMRFTTGGILLPNSSGNRRYEFLLCKLAVGRSFVAQDKSIRPVPAGYDSLLFPSPSYGDLSTIQSLESWKDTPSRLEDLHRERLAEYLIPDSDQVLPCYLVQFDFDPSNVGRAPELVCDVCEQRPAVVFCHHDDARLCGSCDQQVHSANKIVSRHHRVPVSEQPQGFGSCLKHEDMALEFFCPVCFIPICVHCKMIGSHSSGECAGHKLIPISEAYKKAVDSCKSADLPVLDNRKQTIRSQLRSLEERRREVEANTRSVEENVYSIMQQLLDNLKTLSDAKYLSIVSEALELRRQLVEVESSEMFIKQAQSYLPPTEFLKAFASHKQLREEFSRLPFVKNDVDVVADLAVTGSLAISAGQEPSVASSNPLFNPGPSSNLRAQLLKGSKLASLVNNQSNQGQNMTSSTGQNMMSPMGQNVAPQGQNMTSSMGQNVAPQGQNMTSLMGQNVAHQGQNITSSMGQNVAPQGQNMTSLMGQNVAHQGQNITSSMGQNVAPQSQNMTSSMGQNVAPQSQNMTSSMSSFMSPHSSNFDPLPSPSFASPHFSEPRSQTVVKSAKPQDLWKQHLKQSKTRSEQLPQPNLQPPNPPELSESLTGEGIGNEANSPIVNEQGQLSSSIESFVLSNQQFLSKEAQKKVSEIKSMGFKLTNVPPFAESRILQDLPKEAAFNLYYTLPFVDQPATKLFFSTDTHHRSITTLHALCDSNGPTVVLIKYGDYVFGGYAGSPWNVNQTRFGTPKCFLFSVTKDTKIPYHGKGKHSRCLFGSPNCLAFGNTDLVLENDFQNCSSKLENSYGFGLTPGSPECSSYLAGQEQFVPDIVEVWGFDFRL
ncbi:hypothetical protein P9112_005840 [Eukaryota sp. TZLM1-RC]